MITKQSNIIIVKQIAAHMCIGATLGTICVANVRQRILEGFTDETFETYFLPYLDTNRFYFYTLVRIEDEGGTYKIVVNGYDLVTGKPTGHVGISGVDKGAWNSGDYGRVFSRVGWIYYSKKSGVGWSVRVQTSNTYGLVYEPDPQGQSACSPGFVWNVALGRCLSRPTGGGGLPGGGGIPPAIEPVPGETNLFDMKKIIPALVTGVLIYFLSG